MLIHGFTSYYYTYVTYVRIYTATYCICTCMRAGESGVHMKLEIQLVLMNYPKSQPMALFDLNLTFKRLLNCLKLGCFYTRDNMYN